MVPLVRSVVLETLLALGSSLVSLTPMSRPLSCSDRVQRLVPVALVLGLDAVSRPVRSVPAGSQRRDARVGLYSRGGGCATVVGSGPRLSVLLSVRLAATIVARRRPDTLEVELTRQGATDVRYIHQVGPL